MTLDDIIRDIHALQEDLLVFERKYGVLSDTFYQAYRQGEEPANSSWVLDWNEWGATYELLQERRKRYESGQNLWEAYRRFCPVSPNELPM